MEEVGLSYTTIVECEMDFDVKKQIKKAFSYLDKITHKWHN